MVSLIKSSFFSSTPPCRQEILSLAAVTWLGLACGRGLLATSQRGFDTRHPRGYGLEDEEIPYSTNNYFKTVDPSPFVPFTSTHHHGHPQLQPSASALHSD